MLNRRRLLAGTLAAIAAPHMANAQPAAKVYKVGILVAEPAAGPEGFLQALRGLGYVERRNLIIEARYDKGLPDQLPALAADLARLNVDVILAASSTQVRAARQATRTIPIVFAVHNDPVGTGDVASLAHPGGNVTGLTQMASDLSVKQLELLNQLVPGLSRFGVLWNASTPSHEPALRQVEAAARALGLHVSRLEAGSVDELERVFVVAGQERVGAMFVMTSPMTLRAKERLVGLAAKHRMPTMYTQRLFVGAGGLLAYGADTVDLYRRAATYVDKILKGAKPADLPVEQPTKFELVINAKTAKALGLAIPPSLLARADHVIE